MFLVEIQRQAINLLTAELAKLGLSLPRILFWQFDNSGENKNKEMLSFASLLIELELVDEVSTRTHYVYAYNISLTWSQLYYIQIEINFLIVGHTHCKIDQNFSVLSTAIKAALFVASPMAMRSLIGKAHAKTKDRPRRVIKN